MRPGLGRPGRPTLTARWVAANRARLGRSRPSTPGGDVGSELALEKSVGGVFAVPLGRPTSLVERTRFVDNEVTHALGRGLNQIVLVGAGYDGRALRFGGRSARWFEVDSPETLADKQRRLGALGTSAPDVRSVGFDLGRADPSDGPAADLAADLDAALGAAGHDASRPSLFVCESVFTHLTLETVALVCGSLRGRAATGSVLCATFVVVPEARTSGQAVRDVVGQVLEAIGEERRQTFFPGDAEKLYVVTGWSVVRARNSRPHWPGRGAHLVALAGEPAPAGGSASGAGA